ncbi:MAG: hypothetical protein JO297_16930 [Nitrososphaeraceae archaeon]|nr:hypothetical protein [Nitrososphaeraceae archaeon]
MLDDSSFVGQTSPGVGAGDSPPAAVASVNSVGTTSEMLSGSSTLAQGFGHGVDVGSSFTLK